MFDALEKHLTRRKFLKTAGRGLVVGGIMTEALVNPAFAQISAPTEDQSAQRAVAARAPIPPEKRVGWAIVGLGELSLGQLLPAFSQCKKSKPVALVSGHLDKAQQVASLYGINQKNIYNYQNYDAIRNNPEVDIIYIVLPNSMHAEYTIRGARAGKHIMCEKPMANTTQECQAMIDACRRANRKLMIAYRAQYEPYNQAAIQMVRSQRFGPTQMIVAEISQNMDDPNQWRLKKALAGGGSLVDIGIYCLNATRYLTGEEPVEISAMTYSTPGDPRFREVEENINFMLRFPSGVLANCMSSYGANRVTRYRVFAADGWVELDPATAYSGIQMRVGHKDDIEQPQLQEVNQFAKEIDHMSECVMANKQPMTPGEEGLRDIRLIQTIYEAA
ncbi:MAG: Gfo/Idh/MocA family oxidoreductase, partial [Chroococcidiopsidaceae cyanobacterium CP_BM_RX_35]|nr:Gfo/Idh/MocA family oxidoreductase [Chroococcidiopsidaceae cyanobacterium CP_BM_RX_35]